MSELKIGSRVNLETGGNAIIKEELGRGGQGIVYLVDYNGKNMALKWYSNPPDVDFYKNLKNNIEKGSPSEAFLWPEYLTKKEYGCFGYLMKLRPKGYYEFGQFLLAKQKFTSFYSMIACAIKICDGFKKLHDNGYSYQDLNDGNFFINPKNGDVLICDNDNVMPNKQKSGIKGKSRYMAPEVVCGGMPDKYSDRFSLSVILFMLFFIDHPLEGKRVIECPCLTEKYEKKFFGEEPIFIYDSINKNNRPVKNIHSNVMRRWEWFHPLIREVFTKEFSNEKLKNPSTRLIEGEWKKILTQIRAETIICNNCGNETFVSIDFDRSFCIECQKKIEVNHILTIGKIKYVLTPRTKIIIGDDDNPDGIVGITSDKKYYTLTNLKEKPWLIEIPNGNTKELKKNETMPLKDGRNINFQIIEEKGLITIK